MKFITVEQLSAAAEMYNYSIDMLIVFYKGKEFYPFSGNNLCPLENPFPCPKNFFSCVAQDDTNVIDTVSAESYEYCGGKSIL